jgi:hypothetical protein
MVPAENTWSWRLRFIETYPCGLPSTELHRKMDEPWQNLIGLLGHLSREILDGQFFALIVRLVGNAMVQLIRDEQVVRFVGNDAAMSPRVTERDWVILPDS